MKILVLRFSSIGDIVLTTPVLRGLKKQLHAEVHFCTKPAYQPLVEANPHVDRVHTLTGSLAALARTLRAERYDAIVDLHRNLRTRLLRSMLWPVKAHCFPKLNLRKWVYVRAKLNVMPNEHIVSRYLAAVAPLGVQDDGDGLDYFIPYRDEIEPDWIPETHRKGYVAYAIGAQYATKRLPLRRMIELCDRINKPIILLGGKEDAPVGDEIVRFFARSEASEPYEEGLRELRKKALVYNACGKYNFNQSAALVRGAQVVFSHDTGLMHVAAAFGKTVYSIWGNTTPHFGMYPFRTRFVVLENTKVSCRPCSKIGFQKCPRGHFRCMNDIVFDFYIP